MCNGFDKMTSVWDANIKTKVSNKPTVVASSNLCTKVFTLDKTITDFHFSLKAICNSAIACGLNNLQKIRDGEPLGGKASAESDFASDEDDDFLD